MHNEAGVSCLPLHSVQGALLLGEQGYLRSRHLHGSVGHGTSEVPSISAYKAQLPKRGLPEIFRR